MLTLLAALIKVLLKPNRVRGLLKDRKTPSANQSPLCKRPAVEQCPRPTFMGCTCEPGWRGRRATSNVSTREFYHLLAAPPRCVGPAHYSHRPEATTIRKAPESVSRCPRLCACTCACAQTGPITRVRADFSFSPEQKRIFFLRRSSPLAYNYTHFTRSRTHVHTLSPFHTDL